VLAEAVWEEGGVSDQLNPQSLAPIDGASVAGMLRAKVRAAKSQRAIAEQAGVSEQYLSSVLSGREPSQAVLNVIGVRKVVKRIVTYQVVENQS
jgi:hypothetical protein